MTPNSLETALVAARERVAWVDQVRPAADRDVVDALTALLAAVEALAASATPLAPDA
jgi:hypothetical protein